MVMHCKQPILPLESRSCISASGFNPVVGSRVEGGCNPPQHQHKKGNPANRGWLISQSHSSAFTPDLRKQETEAPESWPLLEGSTFSTARSS